MHAKIGMLAVLLAALGLAPQDPEKRPTPPSDAPPLAPVREEFRSAVERKDLLQQFTDPSPLEGVYELRSLERPGAAAIEVRGYLCVGRRYLSVQSVGMTPGAPALQSGFRSYRITGTRLHMTNFLGFQAEPDETWQLVPQGHATSCSWSLIGTVLTFHLDNGDVLEFQRIE